MRNKTPAVYCASGETVESTLHELTKVTQQASSFISMGVAGAAVFPFFMGLVADTDIAMAYYLPIGCYIVIFLFGAKFYKVQFGGNKAI